MDATLNTFVMDRVRRITEVDLTTGKVNWTARGVGEPSLELTGESVDKTDSLGTLIAKIDTAKGANFGAEMDTIIMPLLASQRGATIEVGTEENKVRGKKFDVVKVSGGTATLTYTPLTAPAYVYPINADNTQGDPIEVGTGDENAKVSGATVTLPDGFTASQVGVLYEYETADAQKMSDNSESFTDPAEYIIDMLARDICNSSLKRAGALVFPKAKLDNNVTLNLTTEGTHPFSITALKDYCSEEGNLYYWIWETKA